MDRALPFLCGRLVRRPHPERASFRRGACAGLGSPARQAPGVSPDPLLTRRLRALEVSLAAAHGPPARARKGNNRSRRAVCRGDDVSNCRPVPGRTQGLFSALHVATSGSAGCNARGRSASPADGRAPPGAAVDPAAGRETPVLRARLFRRRAPARPAAGAPAWARGAGAIPRRPQPASAAVAGGRAGVPIHAATAATATTTATTAYTSRVAAANAARSSACCAPLAASAPPPCAA